MLELLVAVVGGAFVLAGLTWRLRFHRTGIPMLRTVLSDPDPAVRATAVDQLSDSVDTYAPELVNLARRERTTEVNEALARLVDRIDDLADPPTGSADLNELRDRMQARTGADESRKADQRMNWRPGRSAELVAQLEQALGQKVMWLRAVTPSGRFDLKQMKENQ